jgi:hypothetical protein
MTQWSLAGRLAGSLTLGAALGPYDYADAITGKDTRIALAVAVAPLFLAIWLDRDTRRKARATLLLIGGLAAVALLIFVFFALGDRSPRLWFLIAVCLIPGTAAFVFGRVAPRISASMKMGIWCGLLAGVTVFAHALVLSQLEPPVTGPCGQLRLNPQRCVDVRPDDPFFGVFIFIFLALVLVFAVFEGIIAVAVRIWITRLANGMSPLGQPRVDTISQTSGV